MKNQNRPPQLFSYVIPTDDGAAPNPSWGECSLAICKPAIRKGADVDDWVIGTGSKVARLSDGKRHNLINELVLL